MTKAEKIREYLVTLLKNYQNWAIQNHNNLSSEQEDNNAAILISEILWYVDSIPDDGFNEKSFRMGMDAQATLDKGMPKDPTKPKAL